MDLDMDLDMDLNMELNMDMDLDMNLYMDLDMDPKIDVDMDLDMGLDMDTDLPGASSLAKVRSPLTCLGLVWGFPVCYGAINWGLFGTCLGPNVDFATGLVQFIVSACYKF